MNKLFSLKLNLKSSLIILSLLIIPAFLPIIHQGFFPSQDYIYIARLFEMNRSLNDGNFPVRWAPDLRYGEPLFNFYAPLPYYVGGILAIILGLFGTVNFVLISKILLILGFVLSSYAMFFLAREFFGDLGGLTAALLYTYAPYHSVDVYVRGALSEHWALIFFPLIFLFAFKLSQNLKVPTLALLSLSLTGLFYAHNVMTLMFMPFFVLWVIFLFLQQRSVRFLIWSFLSFILGASLASSFLLPAFFERQFIQTQYLNSGYFDFRAHFVETKQFFSTFWGYGASVWGGGDGMSFQIGVSHWIVFCVAVILSVLFLLKRKRFTFLPSSSLILFLAGCFLFSLFMMHNKSAFIWERISLLAFIQFPWRFLAVSIFLASFMGGYLILAFKSLSVKVGLTVLVCLLIFIFSLGYFKPEKYYDDNFFDQFVNLNKLRQGFDLPKDYLPIGVKSFEREIISNPHFVDGQGEIQNFIKKNEFVSFQTKSQNGGSVEVPITYFPGWQTEINSNNTSILEPDKFGLIRLPVSAGVSNVTLRFKNTPIREFSNLLTILSFVLLITLFAEPEWFKKNLSFLTVKSRRTKNV